MTNKTLTYSLLIIFSALYLYLFKDFLADSYILSYDDTLILKPLYEVTSIKDYFKKFATTALWDVQPIRDLSFFVDFFLIKHLKFWTHHWSNLIIWILISLTLFKNLLIISEKFSNNAQLSSDSKNWPLFFALIFLFHPTLQIGPFWISNRKHIFSRRERVHGRVDRPRPPLWY